MKTLQDVLATLTDQQAKAVFRALTDHVENERIKGFRDRPCEAVVELLTAVVEELES